MILALRQRHRRIFAMIGIAVPVAFTIGVAARKPVPMMDSLPKELTTLAQPSAADELEAGDVFAKRAVGNSRAGSSAPQ